MTLLHKELLSLQRPPEEIQEQPIQKGKVYTISDFNLTKVLGKGSFGKVLSMHITSGYDVQLTNL